jgi:prolyl oligopeptidase PreP (S9A serine peptidase family)
LEILGQRYLPITWQRRTYPPILIATSRRDDRAHPGHARKTAAKLQAMGYEAHFLRTCHWRTQLR